MWTSIAYVSGGVTLAAFCAAIAAWTFRRKLLGDAKTVRSAPTSERARLVLARHGVISDTDTARVLTPNRMAIIKRKIDAAASRFRITAFVVIGLAMLAATISTFAIFKASQSREVHRHLDEKLNQIDAIRGKLEDVQSKVQSRLILVPEASSWAQTSAEYGPSPLVKNLADTLEDLLRSYEEEFGGVKISDDDRLRLRLAKASVANATGDFEEGLALLSKEDEQAGLDVVETRANSFFGLRRWSQALVRFEAVTNVRSEKWKLVAQNWMPLSNTTPSRRMSHQ